ncbi:glycoside hydrolase family 88 protein [Duganella violaceipulchra]|uniref:Glycoside hydrolase family 88 protein n=1 Tax=Duganella violaceipulchra TaxID=2849652 RepID=A0AA41H5Q0_9BURK|nr:glycoside hydrolase family 88 protein [Duganella violaceicalia]MBV6319475.1 glycoside hydrolase family 88 protein [Duganella violaceicalia]MCP2006714.1 unsaturated chondroitin disaccharide hydrolase [Duganella violaceicalia]
METLRNGSAPRRDDQRLVEQALASALAAIDRNLAHFGEQFPAPSSVGGVYPAIGNDEWTNGFWTGMLWLAYEASGAPRYREAAERHVLGFHRRQAERHNVAHHDLGFLYSLSCVPAYQLTGSTVAAEAALGAARLLLERYQPRAGIIQAWGDLHDPEQAGRMIIDCNLNLPLLYWASNYSGEPAFRDAANRHIEAAARHIVRADGSTFHTFFFDPATGAPRHGKTHQGHADDSCWARGQAWGICGFPLVYRHNGDTRLLELSKVLANYYLNRLPDDGICYWDLVFTSGAEERDSSAAAIAACGLLELSSNLPLLDPLRNDYQDAALRMVRQLSTHYRGDDHTPGGGLLRHAVYHKPQRMGVDESCIWGDYFYLEALLRLSRNWASYW